MGLFHLLVVCHHRKSGQELERGSGKLLLADLLFIACSACFLHHPGLPARDGTAQNGLTPFSEIKKIPHRLVNRPICWGYFLKWGSLFLDYSSLSGWQKANQHNNWSMVLPKNVHIEWGIIATTNIPNAQDDEQGESIGWGYIWYLFPITHIPNLAWTDLNLALLVLYFTLAKMGSINHGVRYC